MTGPARVAAVEGALSFESFFRAEYPRLARALLLLTGAQAEAEDLAQEALARTYERWERVRAMESPQGYVYRTALNLHRKQLRWLGVRSRKLLAGSHEPDPAEAAGARLDVLAAMRALPLAQRQAIVLVEWLQMTAEEAGRTLGIAPESVRGRCHRARKTLKEALSDG